MRGNSHVRFGGRGRADRLAQTRYGGSPSTLPSPNGAFDAGLRPGPLPDRVASLLPGLLAATRTGLTPAGGDELMFGSGHHAPPPNAGHTSYFPQKATCLAAARRRCRLRLASQCFWVELWPTTVVCVDRRTLRV